MAAPSFPATWGRRSLQSMQGLHIGREDRGAPVRAADKSMPMPASKLTPFFVTSPTSSSNSIAPSATSRSVMATPNRPAR